MNAVRLREIFDELQQQKERLRDHYHQSVGAAAIIEKILKEFPEAKPAEKS